MNDELNKDNKVDCMSCQRVDMSCYFHTKNYADIIRPIMKTNSCHNVF